MPMGHGCPHSFTDGETGKGKSKSPSLRVSEGHKMFTFIREIILKQYSKKK